MPPQAQTLYEFGPFRLDPVERCLWQEGNPVPLTPKAFQTLLFLVENSGRVVEKEELLQRVWPDTFVEEATLAQNIFTIRKQLRDEKADAPYIETVPKRGYRFRAPVRTISQSSEEIAPQAHSVRTRRIDPALLFAGAAVAVALAVTFFGVRSSSNIPAMLVVLPVENLTGDANREYVADGLTEELIAQLGSLNPTQLRVIARTSSMAYKGTTKRVDQIGRELGADYVLESSLRQGSGDIRFTVQLIRTRDQTHLWAHSFERPMADVLSLQGELARTIAEEIRIELTPQQRARIALPRSVDPEAYDAFVQGRYHWNERTAAEITRAIGYFQTAIAKDPDFAPAYSSLADSYAMLASMKGGPPADLMPKAKDALLKALSLDDSMSEAHTSLGWTMEVFDWDWAGSEREFRKAIELDPNNATAHHRYAIHLTAMGHLPEALHEMMEAQRLDPLSPVIMTSTGWVYLRGRQPDAAMKECRNALDLDPKFVRGHLCLGEAFEEKGDLRRAAAAFLQGKLLAGDKAEILEALQRAVEERGYQGYFETRLKQLTDPSNTGYVSPYDLADIHLRLGDREAALDWLDKAYAQRSPYLVNLQVEPRLDPLRNEQRFQDLVQCMRLAAVQVTPLPR